jgi:hypothetical protein
VAFHLVCGGTSVEIGMPEARILVAILVAEKRQRRDSGGPFKLQWQQKNRLTATPSDNYHRRAIQALADCLEPAAKPGRRLVWITVQHIL